jgi:PAS domain S-box-containing protein
VAEASLPESIVHYVVRTQESVILDDASAQNPFSADTYIRQHHARSILCLPLLKQAKLIGVLYLENNLTSHVFTPTRIAVLKLLASQAAISLENTRLYSDLTEREAKIRRLVDANIIGILIWNLEGRIVEANEAFLHMVGYGREDLVSGRVSWSEVTPDKWRAADEQALAELAAIGVCEPFEKEYFRKDGSRVPVLIGAALLEGRRDEGVAFVLDLTERKLAEEALHKTQAELAHVTRVATLGEMTASIAHEVNQPLTAVIANANASLRWLAAATPNLDEARNAVSRIIRDGNRAGDVIARIRALVQKTDTEKVRIDINQIVQEVVILMQNEAVRKGVAIRMDLADDVSLVLGDRIQLQQVILNLVMNAIEAMDTVTDRPWEMLIRSSHHESDHLLVAVQDSGTGIDPPNLERIFYTFYTTKPQGMGMGLAICRSIVEAHGGRLWATANEDRGATFRFTLPAVSDAVTTDADAAIMPDHGTKTG